MQAKTRSQWYGVQGNCKSNAPEQYHDPNASLCIQYFVCRYILWKSYELITFDKKPDIYYNKLEMLKYFTVNILFSETSFISNITIMISKGPTSVWRNTLQLYWDQGIMNVIEQQKHENDNKLTKNKNVI